MHNNLFTIINKYPAKQASWDFNVSYGKLRRVITAVKQHRGPIMRGNTENRKVRKGVGSARL